MASEAQRVREIRAALRQARSKERALDTALERYERELLRLRARKTRILPEEVQKLAGLWDQLTPRVSEAQSALSDFIAMVYY